MKISSQSNSFQLLLRVFRKNVSSGSPYISIPVQEGEIKIGAMGELSHLIHSQINNLVAYRKSCESKEIPVSPDLEVSREILVNCFRESLMHDYPELTFSTRFEIRSDRMIAVPADAYILDGIDSRVICESLSSFFPKLRSIMRGTVIHPESPWWETIPGHVVGRVTEDITKQLTLFHRATYKEHDPYIRWTERDLHENFEDKEHWRFIVHEFSVRRMKLQIDIATNILTQAIRSQGFDVRATSEFSLGSPVDLSIRPNWDIVVSQ